MAGRITADDLVQQYVRLSQEYSRLYREVPKPDPDIVLNPIMAELNDIAREIRSRGNEGHQAFRHLLKHPDGWVRKGAAANLYDMYPRDSGEVLNALSRQHDDIDLAYTAKRILDVLKSD